MVNVSFRRALTVTFGLSILGLICGALLGGVAVLVDLGRHLRQADVGGSWGAFSVGAMFGAFVGAILGPLVAWVFLRRVPLCRAIAETALGTLAGILGGALLATHPILLLGLFGFLLAALRLWFTARMRAR